MAAGKWPAIPYEAWRETCEALHLWTQVVGKYRLSHTPWVNHSWHATLYVTPRGLTTGNIPDGDETISLEFDLCEHRLVVQGRCDVTETFPLEEMSVSGFLERMKRAITKVGGTPTLHELPNEVPHPIPFPKDTAPRPYDRGAVERFHQALLSIDRVFHLFRTSFLGKVSPVHLFWGSFDLAVTRFSGRRAPLHPGGVPHLPDDVAQEAYDHEVSSAGFWPGGNGVEEPMFYSYVYPPSDAFKASKIEPSEASYDETLGEFLLPYEVVRTSPDPERTLLRFLDSTYAAAADTGGWDRASLECARGRPGVPRPATPA